MHCELGSDNGTFFAPCGRSKYGIGGFTGFADVYLKANPRARPCRGDLVPVAKSRRSRVRRPILAPTLLKIDVDRFGFEALRFLLQRTPEVMIEDP